MEAFSGCVLLGLLLWVEVVASTILVVAINIGGSKSHLKYKKWSNSLLNLYNMHSDLFCNRSVQLHDRRKFLNKILSCRAI